MELANMVKFTFLFFIGMDRIAILVDLLKLGGLPLTSKFSQGVSLAGNGDSLVSDWHHSEEKNPCQRQGQVSSGFKLVLGLLASQVRVEVWREERTLFFFMSLEDWHLLWCRRGKGVNSTPHLARIRTRIFFARGSSSHRSVLRMRCLQNIHHLARCFTRH